MEINTVEYWLDKLPEPERSKALKNAGECDLLGLSAYYMPYAILRGFFWGATEEGHEYWKNIFKRETL